MTEDDDGATPTVWMFQFNPDHYDLREHIKAHGPFDWWETPQHRQRMRIGERVYILQSGGTERAGIVATARIVSPVYLPAEGERQGRHSVDLAFEAYIEPPLSRQEIRADAVLATYRPYAVGVFQTNFPLPPDVAARTEELVRSRLRPIATNADGEEELSPESVVVDERTRVIANIVRRQGQPEFRQQLLRAYDGRCAVTGCDAVAALEAAHIIPYRGPHTNDITNGLLLRADIHNLFDLGLWVVDTATMMVRISPQLASTAYVELDGVELHLPAHEKERPSRTALDSHRKWAGL